MNAEQTFPAKCQAALGLYCRPLATRVRAPIQATLFGFGFVKRTRIENNAYKEEFVGIGYKVAPNDPGTMCNYCCFCGEKILREDMAMEHSPKTGHTQAENRSTD